MKKKYKSPLNGRGNATLIAAPALFGVTEAIFHAHPLVGGAVGLLGGAIAYRHYYDVTAKVEGLKEGVIDGYEAKIPQAVQSRLPSVGGKQPSPKHTGDSVEDGYLSISPDIKLHADDIIGNRTLIVGLPGSGKTNLGANLAQGLGEYDIPLLIPDLKQDYISIASLIPNCLVAGPNDISLSNAREVASALFEERLKLIINFPEFDSFDDAMEVTIEIIKELFAWARRQRAEERRPCGVFLDEAQALFPQSGGSILEQKTYQKALTCFSNVVSMGRSLGLFPVVLTQRLAQTDKKVCAQRDICFLMRQTSKQDLDAYADIVDIKKFYFSSFKAGECVYVDARGKGTCIQCLKRRSEDKSFTPKLEHSRRATRTHERAEVITDDLEMEDLPQTQILPETPTPTKMSIQVGLTNGTKEPVFIEESVFEMLLNAARVGNPISIKSIMALTNLSEQHSKNVAAMVREQCEIE